MHQLGDLRQLAAGFFDGLDVGGGFGQANNSLRGRGLRRYGRARCRGRRGWGRQPWPGPESAETALPGWACCSKDWRRGWRRRRASGAAGPRWRSRVRVELWVQPAHTGTRPAAASITMRTARSHSSSSSVAASPVEPQATIKSIPESICQFTSAQSAGFIDRSVRPERRDDCRAATRSFHHQKCISSDGAKVCDREQAEWRFGSRQRGWRYRYSDSRIDIRRRLHHWPSRCAASRRTPSYWKPRLS